MIHYSNLKCLIILSTAILHLPSAATAADATHSAQLAAQIESMQPAAPKGDLGAPKLALSSEQQIAALQQQVQALQAQVAALTAVLKVTASGATLQAATVTIIGNDGVAIQTSRSFSLAAGQNLNLQASVNTAIKGGATTAIEGSGLLDLKGGVIKLNGGTKPLATVGSQVQVPKQAIGQVTTGSANVLGN